MGAAIHAAIRPRAEGRDGKPLLHVGSMKGPDTRRLPRTILTCRSLSMDLFSAGNLPHSCGAGDLAVTLASLLGIDAPALATGGVLTEAYSRRVIPQRQSAAAVIAFAEVNTSTHAAQRRNSMTPIGAPDLSVTVAGIELKNPILAASGTFGYGIEFEDSVHLDRLGGLVVEGLSKEAMTGNPPPRL